MEIFFCDSCAARVTSADLQRGQGLKKGEVVICQTCIEKGLGGDLLAAAGAVSEPVAVTVDSHPEPDAQPPPPDTDTLVRVGEQMLARSDADLHNEPAPEGFSADEVMAEAASGFDALSPSAAVRHDDGEDDVAETGDLQEEFDDDAEDYEEDESDDESEDEPGEEGDQQSEMTDDSDDEDGENDEDDEDDDYEDDEDEDEDEQDEVQLFPDDGKDLPPQGQVETIEIAHADRPSPSPGGESPAPKKKKKRRKGGGAKARGGPSHRAAPADRGGARRSSGRQPAVGAAASARGSASKSARSAAAGAKSGRPSTRRPKLDNTAKGLIAATAVAGLVFVVVLVVWAMKPSGGSPSRGTGRSNPETELIQEVQRVRTIVDAALTRGGSGDHTDLTADDIPALERALEEMNNPRLSQLYDEFEAAARAEGWSEAQMGRALRQYSDLRTRRRTLNDLLGVLRRRRGNR